MDNQSSAGTANPDPEQGLPSAGRRPFGSLMLRLGVSAGLFGLIAWRVDMVQLLEILSRVPVAGFLAIAAIALVIQAPAALRWHFVLGTMGQSLTLAQSVRFTLIGIFSNQVLPSTVGGDVVRAWFAARTGIRFGASARSVVIDRIAGVIMWVLAGLAALPFLIADSGGDPVAWAMAATLAAAALAIAMIMLADRVPLLKRAASLKSRRFVMRMFQRVIVQATLLAPETRNAFSRPFLHLLSLIYLLGTVTIIYCAALLIDVPVAFTIILAVVPPALLLAAFPVSFAGWGVREGAMIAGLSIVGVSPEQALTISVLFGLALVIGSLPGGIMFAFADRTRSASTVDISKGEAAAGGWRGPLRPLAWLAGPALERLPVAFLPPDAGNDETRRVTAGVARKINLMPVYVGCAVLAVTAWFCLSALLRFRRPVSKLTGDQLQHQISLWLKSRLPMQKDIMVVYQRLALFLRYSGA